MDPEYGEVRFHASGRVEAEGRVVDPATWTVAGKAELLPAGTLSGGKAGPVAGGSDG